MARLPADYHPITEILGSVGGEAQETPADS